MKGGGRNIPKAEGGGEGSVTLVRQEEGQEIQGADKYSKNTRSRPASRFALQKKNRQKKKWKLMRG